MSKFRVGERARLVCNSSGRVPVGTEVVVSGVTDGSALNDRGNPVEVLFVYNGLRFGCPESWLEKLAPELGSWSDIAHIWKPEGVTA